VTQYRKVQIYIEWNEGYDLTVTLDDEVFAKRFLPQSAKFEDVWMMVRNIVEGMDTGDDKNNARDD